ncbi:iron-containing alcohol dehydrogenase [Marinovum sp. 2_MG-2023]|uniref:iron-containing alcohol dehydrogenase n=1 Tax=unclassified Marinovum TaxID=2647166 RepID=UPI0026E42460|nr:MULTISPECIES: iron-containing alcohol dehydrogenase [unclassified Marinovum]MDO6732394.1 iron-containing alcohol dehydrogenase [Marinovum sp. 2_MG-2023]MDO6781711.1 iron-containing alcohol dehydrogenase [Marinovum sp. 1_MG-2023]
MNTSFGIMRAPDAVLFGSGQRQALGRVAAEFGTSTLICTDERFADCAEMQEMLTSLETAGVAVKVFSGTQPELPIDGIVECQKAYADYRPDSVIGVGGGSCLDMAKFISLLMTHGGDLSDYYGEFNVPGPIIPVIAIPTTSGTGSEVTPVAVVADNARDLKVGVSSPYMIPKVAICDPELTLTCPPGLTAVAGADALTHAIEAFTAINHEATPDIGYERVFVGKNLLSDQFALSAITEISASLVEAVENGSNLEARSRLMMGALLAGMAFGAAGTAAAHAIQYPVGAITKTAHGLGVASLMPYVMRFNADGRETEYAEISRAMGSESKDVKVLAEEAIERVRALFAEVRIPETLADLGLEEDRLDWVASQSMSAARLINNNPRKLDIESITTLVNSAFHGKTEQELANAV